MRIVFFGTPQVAIPSLRKLKDYIVCVVTQPDKPKGRGQKLSFSPVKEEALKLGIDLILQPESTKDVEFRKLVESLSPDFIVVVSYGKMLGRFFREIPKKGALNLHFSLLPKYRGAAPVAWAILNGDKVTGVTIQKIAGKLDAGDIVEQKEVEIIEGETRGELENRLALVGAELLLHAVENFDNITAVPQDPERVSFAPMLQKEDGLIDWKEKGVVIERKVRAFNPWPSAYTYLNGKLLKIHKAKAYDSIESIEEVPVGAGIVHGKECYIRCGEGYLKLLEVQLEGRDKIAISDFINGMRLKTGFILGDK